MIDSLTPFTLVWQARRALSGASAILAVVTIGMALFSTIVPRAVDGFLSDGLRYDAAQSSAIARDLIADQDGNLDYGAGSNEVAGFSPGSDEVWGSVDDKLARLRAGLPEPLRQATDRAEFTVVTKPALSQPYGKPAAGVSVGYDPRLLSRIEFVSGRAPENAPGSIPSIEQIEVVASFSVADTLSWGLGETRTLSLPDRLQQDLVLVGIFKALDSSEPYWAHTTAALAATVISTPPSTNATVFANASGVEASVASVLTTRSSVWYPVGGQHLASADIATLAQQVRKFTSTSQDIGKGTSLAFRSNLADVLEAAERRNESSRAIVATVLAGPLGLAATVEILVAKLLADRARSTVVLLAARGASRRQRGLLLGLPALAVGIPSTAIGVFLALQFPGGELGAVGAAAIVAVALAPAALLVWLGANPGPQSASGRGAAWFRIGAECLVVLATLAAVITLARGSHEAGGFAGLDTLAISAPLMLSLSGCVVAVRILPLVLTRWLRVVRRWRGVAPVVGVARALRAGGGNLVLVAAILIGVSVALFSGVLSSTLASGVLAASEAQVGADVAIDRVRLDSDQVEEIRAIDGVAAAAAISTEVFHYLLPDDAKRITVTAILVDPSEVERVQLGRQGALEAPDALSGKGPGGVPVIVSSAVAEKLFGQPDVELDRNAVQIVGDAQQGIFFGTSNAWVLADRGNSEAITFAEPDIANQVLVRLKPGASLAHVLSALRAVAGGGAVVTTPGDAAALRASNPAVGGVHTAALVAIGCSGVLSSAVLALALILSAGSRRTSFTVLAAMGLSRKQGRHSVFWELSPLAFLGIAGGVVLGAVLAWVMLTTIDLRPFTGGTAQPPIRVDWILVASIVSSYVCLLTAAALASAIAALPRSFPRLVPATAQDWTS